MSNTKTLSYISTGVNYSVMDPLKRLAQKLARSTSSNFDRFGMREVPESRGESAYVWKEKDAYKTLVIEGLGTKNLVADEMQKITGKSYYKQIAQDTLAMIVNDVVVVGAKPAVINAYFATGGPEWFSDQIKSSDLVKSWAKICHQIGAVWGGGETPGLKGIIAKNTIDLAGSCYGIIKPKERLVLGDKLKEGDVIFLIESSGIHANGVSLARAIAKKLKKGYGELLSNGNTYGEDLLKPTYLYSNLVNDLFEAGVKIHYMVNITGHGWRKLMRANKEFTYVIDNIPTPQLIFDFIQKHSGNNDYEMYGNFNMGAGFAIYLPEKYLEKAQQIAKKNNFRSWKAGRVEKGSKQVIIKPKNITFKAGSLGVR